LPAFVVIPTIKLILNGIATTARMKGHAVDCLFCGMAEGDRIEHMVNCPKVLLAYSRILPQVARISGPVLGHRRVTLASEYSLHEIILYIVSNDLLVFAYHAKLHGGAGEVADLMHARMRMLRLRGVVEISVG
jgi:hypothetical protein